MQIQGQQVQGQQASQEKPAQMREGEVYRARVESRLSDREAMISIRGQQVHAAFEGGVPERDRVNIEVKGKTEEGVRVREIKGDSRREGGSRGPNEQQEVTRVLRNLGQREPSAELRQATRQLMDRGVPLTRESVSDLAQYTQSNRGSAQQRQQTVQVMAAKRLEPTANQIRAVHDALHGSRLSDQVRAMAGETPRIEGRTEGRTAQAGRVDQGRTASHPRQDVARAAEQVRIAMLTGQGLRQSIENLQQVSQQSGDRETRQQVNQALREMITLQASNGREAASQRIAQLVKPSVPQQTMNAAGQTQQLHSLLQSTQQVIADSANLSNALTQVREQLSQANLPQDMTQRLTAAIDEANTRFDSGRELKARQTLTQTIQDIQQALPQQATSQSLSDSQREMQEYMRNEIVQTLGMNPKAVLITEVTERLAQATDDFKAFQRDASKQLNRIESMVKQFRNQAAPQVKPMLDNVIKQLDRQLMKSEWMLFADMKTERRMLGASAQLHDAKKLLSQGKHSEARQIVSQVQSTIDQVQFKPSNQRVQHMITQEQNWSEPKTPVHRMAEQFDHSSRMMTYNDGSARQLFEGMRGLGMNREAELAQILAGGRDVPTDAQQRNLKTILMQLAKSEDEGSRMLQQQAQNSLSQMNGQQLLNRNEPQQNHMYYFQVPLMVKGESENLQVYVNSRNEGDQVDWENCNLYFHMETSSLGPLGIVLNVSDRNLTVTLKNDTDHFAESVEPLADRTMEQLQDIGYHVGKLSVKPMTVPETATVGEVPDQTEDPEGSSSAPVPFMTEKGFDYKV
ncbi:hypothetical protein [Salisediminibacterium beveridgei]|uniref:Hook-length control protein FliK n=1 Tax=Salisediminibacterium beveridgei TaxID=632773 RepID=A0A1D7QUP1_9BACI|nr:hypothetical protein [Salisediminibacterium beveridgei]AOM82699.1 hypothetical protein BBEV_1336 [Salisediminibacterium beveridgei]